METSTTVVISANTLQPQPSTPSGQPTDVFNLNNLNNAQPRLLHPKKRKFDYAEMEEIDQQTTSLALEPVQGQTIIYQQAKEQNGAADNFELVTTPNYLLNHTLITVSASSESPKLEKLDKLEKLEKLDKRSHSGPGDNQEHVRMQQVSLNAKKLLATNYR